MPESCQHPDDCGCSCSDRLHLAQRAARYLTPSRRQIIATGGAAAVGVWLARNAQAAQAGGRTDASKSPVAAPMRVQPVLTYQLHQPREKTSWRPWGGLLSDADVNQEIARIGKELAGRSEKLSGLEFLPVAKASNVQEAKAIGARDADVMLIYASGSDVPTLEALLNKDRPTLFFLRHNSGPISLWYETLHPRFLRNGTDAWGREGITVEDVVVDEYDELDWRLRALAALKRTLGQRIVAIGGPGGWGPIGREAPKIARSKWRLDIRDYTYDDLGKRIESARRDDTTGRRAAQLTDSYLAQPGVQLKTDRKYVHNAMLLCSVFKDILREHDARAITIHNCMSTIMPVAETTACLPLSLLNDEGYLAFCESDFVVIPVGMLMHHIAGVPVFLNDPTWPHDGMVTIAHCTAPRRMDGRHDEPTEIHTHFESDFGAAPKVALRKGQELTNVVPDFAGERFVMFRGKVLDNPFHAICRSQTDISIEGDWKRLLTEMRGFHWMTIYGDHRREIAYAVRHLGIQCTDVSV